MSDEMAQRDIKQRTVGAQNTSSLLWGGRDLRGKKAAATGDVAEISHLSSSRIARAHALWRLSVLLSRPVIRPPDLTYSCVGEHPRTNPRPVLLPGGGREHHVWI